VKKRFQTTLLMIACVLSWLLVGPVSAEEAKPDVRVIIDISGSMKQNDPQNLRRPALELLVRLFPEDSKAGVWTFGQWVNMLVKHKVVDEQWRQDALQQAQKINSVALHTNIPAALEKAVDDIAGLDTAYKTSLILLTDGMVDVSKDEIENAAARENILNNLLPRLAEAGVTIHTVSLSHNADKELMERLAVESGGLSAVAETAEDLTRIFLQAFDASAPAEELPLEDNSFLVDSSVEEFTALIFRKNGSPQAVLVGPDEKRYSRDTQDADVKWFSQQNYDLITVKRPYEGEWNVLADLEPNSRITVVSDLSLHLERLPINHYVNDKPVLSGSLQEKGVVVTRSELLSLVDVTVNVVRESDQQHWTFSLTDDTPASGEGDFSTRLSMLESSGSYRIEMIADGKTFRRQQSQRIKVRNTFSTNIDRTETEGQIDYHLSLTPHNMAVDLPGTTVIAQVTSPDGSSHMKPAILESKGWKIVQPGGDYSGEYQVIFAVVGKYNDGKNFSYRSEPVQFTHEAINPKPLPVVEVVREQAEKQAPEKVKEPEVKPEPVLKAEPEPAPKLEKLDEEKSISIWLWVAIIVGNLAILGLGYLAYRMIMGDKNSGILDEDDFIEEEVTEAKTEPKPELEKEEPAAEVVDEPIAALEDEVDVEAIAEPEPAVDLEMPVETEDASDAEIVEEQEEQLEAELVEPETAAETAEKDTEIEGAENIAVEVQEADNNEIEQQQAEDIPESPVSEEADEPAQEVVTESEPEPEEEEDDDLGLPDDVIDLDLSTESDKKT
jgi:uncharacterized protein (TIGR03503 family)